MSDTERTGLALLAREVAPPWDLVAPRFPVARRGYDRDAVEDYIAELERELEELRGGQSSSVTAEIERIGEQTAAILRVAHEQAAQTTRRAHEEADRCLSAAAANAVKMTEDAQEQVRQLDLETDTIWRERARLLEDVRNLATSLFALAEDALERFPPEADRPATGSQPTMPVPVAAAPPADEEPISDEDAQGAEDATVALPPEQAEYAPDPEVATEEDVET
jgi:cell division septum initiation protein DivIVA